MSLALPWLGAVGSATALALAGILAFAAVVTGLAAALAFAGILALASVLFLGLLVRFLSGDWSCAVNEDLIPVSRFDAWMVAPLPASKPASAAPAIKAFFDLVISRISSCTNEICNIILQQLNFSREDRPY